MAIRMPNRSDLTSEQKQVLDDLPREGLSLITGPPGTGKTVIGLWRALKLSRRGTETVRFVCFNRILKFLQSLGVKISGDNRCDRCKKK